MFSFPPFSQLRDGDFRRSGVSFPLGGSSDPLRPHSQAAITTGRRERAAVRPRPARERARETSALEGAGKGAPRGIGPPNSSRPLLRIRENSYSRSRNGKKPPSLGREETPRLPVAGAANGRCSPHTPALVASGAVPANASTSNRFSSHRKLAMRLRRGAGVGVGANAKQRRRQQQPEFLPPPRAPPPPPPGEAADRLQLHLQQQPASPPPGAPLDLGREQPRQQLETKINSPHPKLRAQRGEAQREPRLPRASPLQPTREVSKGLLRLERSECACVCVCVCVCTSVCAFGILPPPPPPTGGSVQLSDWSARPRPKAARPERTRIAETARDRSTTSPGGQGGSGGTAAPRGRHTPPNDREEESSALWAHPVLSLSGWQPPAKNREPRGSALDGTARSQHPRSPNFSSGEESPREGDAMARESLPGAEEKEALTSARLMPAARGPTHGSRPAAALSEVGGARGAGRGPCRRGGRR